MSGTSASAGEAAGARVGEPGLDVANGVVAEISGQPAAKARQSGPRRGPIAAKELADERQRVALVTLDDAAAILDLDRAPATADTDFRRQPDERVASEALTADDRFQQVGKALVRELDVEGKRRVEVGERLEHERNAVITLRREREEFDFGHDAPTVLLPLQRHCEGVASARDAGANYEGRRQRQSLPRGDDHRPLLQL